MKHVKVVQQHIDTQYLYLLTYNHEISTYSDGYTSFLTQILPLKLFNNLQSSVNLNKFCVFTSL